MYYYISHDINNAYMTKSIFNLLFHQKTLVNRKAAIAVISLVLKPTFRTSPTVTMPLATVGTVLSYFIH